MDSPLNLEFNGSADDALAIYEADEEMFSGTPEGLELTRDKKPVAVGFGWQWEETFILWQLDNQTAVKTVWMGRGVEGGSFYDFDLIREQRYELTAEINLILRNKWDNLGASPSVYDMS